MSGIPALETDTGTKSPVTKYCTHKYLVELMHDAYEVKLAVVLVREEQRREPEAVERLVYYVDGKEVDPSCLFDTERDAVDFALRREAQRAQHLALELERASLLHRTSILRLAELSERSRAL